MIDWLLDTAPRWHYLAILIACVVLTLPLELALGARVYRQPSRLLATIAVMFLLENLWGGATTTSRKRAAGCVKSFAVQ